MMTSFLIPPAVAALITALCTAVLIRRDRRRMTPSWRSAAPPAGADWHRVERGERPSRRERG
ncbi:hypothetical protein [Streptomyces sp. NPDC001494]